MICDILNLASVVFSNGKNCSYKYQKLLHDTAAKEHRVHLFMVTTKINVANSLELFNW